MKLYLFMVLLLAGVSFGSDANYIVTLKNGQRIPFQGYRAGNSTDMLRSSGVDLQQDVAKQLHSRGIEIKRRFWLTGSFTAYIPPERLAEIGSLPGVERVTPNRRVFLMRQSSGSLIGTPYAWNLGLNGSGIKIAILDTGLNASHAEFTNRVVNETDFYYEDGIDVRDYYGHGTHVAGIAAGSLYGVARNASILNVKVFPNNGSSTTTDVIIDGINWAVSQGADVISLSLGSSDVCNGSDDLAITVDAAVDMGVTVVAAAGNNGPSAGTIESPGCSKEVITVGNTNGTDGVYSSSSRGPTSDNRTKPDLTAPGVNINSTYYTSGYAYMTGTSMSTPFVSGAAILLKEKNPALTPRMIKAVLMNSAKDLGSPGIDATYGAGRLNLSEAVRETGMVLEDTTSPANTRTYPIYVSNGNRTLKVTLYWSEAWNATSDLNLTLISPNGTLFSNYNGNEVFEQVAVAQPERGIWQLNVSSDTDRTFAIAFSQNATFSVSTIPQSRNTTANSTLNFTVVLENSGAANDSFALSAAEEVSHTFSNSSLQVPSNSSVSASLFITVPQNATAGDWPVTISAASNATGDIVSYVAHVYVFGNLSLDVLPMSGVNRSYNLTIRVNITGTNNATISSAMVYAYLQSPLGADYSQQLAYQSGLYVTNFKVPANSSVGMWNATVNASSPFYFPASGFGNFTVSGRMNVTIRANQTMVAGYNYTLNATIFDELGNPMNANASWYLNGTNVLNGTEGLFSPSAQDIGGDTLILAASKPYYNDGSSSLGLQVIDVPPQMSNLSVTPSHFLLPNETFNVSTFVTDNLNVSLVWANITFPNSSAESLILSQSGNTYYKQLNFSSNGTYLLNIFANDSSGNITNQSELLFVYPAVNVTFNLNITGLLRILPVSYNETRNSTNLSVTMRLPAAEYRLRLESGNATVQFNNVLLNEAAAINLTFMPANVSSNDAFQQITAYDISAGMNFSSATVSFGYGPELNSSRLSIYHCITLEYGNCTPMATQIDQANGIASAQAQNFSVYLLGLNKSFSAAILAYPATVASGEVILVSLNVTLDGSPLSDVNFSITVGGTLVSAARSFSGGIWNLSFTAPQLSDGARFLLVEASYSIHTASDYRAITYYTPAQKYTVVQGGGYYSTASVRNSSDRTDSSKNESLQTGNISLDIPELASNLSLYAGTERILEVPVFNSGRRAFVTVSLSGIDPSLFFSDSGFVNYSETRRFKVFLKIPQGTDAGNYTIYANALVDGKKYASTPFSLEILVRPTNFSNATSRIVAKTTTITKVVLSETPVIQLEVLTNRPERVVANYVVKNAETGEVVSNYSEGFLIEKSGILSKQIAAPKNLSAGIYVIETVLSYEGGSAKDITTFEVLPAPSGPYDRLKDDYLKAAAIMLAGGICIVAVVALSKRPSRKKKDEKWLLDAKQLPKSGLYLGGVKGSAAKAYFRMNDLLLHMIAAGGTGSGKTVAVMDFIEEALEAGAKVVVFDPTAQWTGFPKQASGEMLGRYPAFGMGAKKSASYPANIVSSISSETPVDIEALPAGLTVFDMHGMPAGVLDRFIENTIRSIFAANLPESKSLKYLVVYDEIHRSLPKYGGKRSYIALERACREFRKWGIGLIMISQVLSDFRGAIRANIGTEIQMRTKYEADIERLGSKYGREYSKVITGLKVGEGILQNPEHNFGKPYLVQFRPLKHSESRASDEELNAYQALMERAGSLESAIGQIKKKAGLEAELNLAREKTRIFAFRMAGAYLDSIEEQLKSADKTS